jgi:Ca-activated chloride channel homolog
MTNKSKINPLKVQVQADKAVIHTGKPGERIVEIRLTAPEADQDRPRVPLNLALVLDRSGSMHGDKLHYARQAAAHVIDLLGEQDRAAVVVYDDQVQVLASSQVMGEKAKRQVKGKIAQIRSGSSTNLFGGWMTGCHEVAEAASADSFNRTLLLTDGLANVGERDPGRLTVHTHELFVRGISTSCFGVGQGYDEHLLETMANHGGGSFHFLETLNAIPTVFEREFDEIINVALRDLELTIELPEAVQASVSANWHNTREGKKLKVFLGSLSAGRDQAVYLRLENLAGSDNGILEIPVKVMGKDADQRVHEATASLSFTTVTAEEETAQPQDQDLMERFALVDLADKANQAMQMEREGDRLGSSQLVRNSIHLYQANVDQKTVDKYQMMSDEMQAGYNDMDRKRRHFQEYRSKRGWQSIQDYQLVFQAGLPMARIEGKSVLINTAAPVSMAVDAKWLLLNEVYQFSHTANGLTCEGLSKALGVQVDVMLGMDVLRDLHVRTDPTREVIQFSRDPFRSSGARLPLREEGGSPTTQLTINGSTVTFRLVTALRLNYIPGALAASLNPVGQAEDGLPGGEKFETPLYKLTLPLGRRPLTLNCGIVTGALRQQLALGEGDGIMGADLLQTVPLTLAFPAGEMILYL